MTVSEEGEYVGCGIEEQSDPSVHNCSISYPLWVLGCSLVGRGALNFLISSVLGASIGEMANLSTI
jgi:hypothetical protein